MKNFNEEFQMIIDDLNGIAKIENQLDQMHAYLKIPKRLEEIWLDGFNHGVEKLDKNRNI